MVIPMHSLLFAWILHQIKQFMLHVQWLYGVCTGLGDHRPAS